MVRMKFSIQYHAAIRKKLKIDRGLPGRTRTPSTARPRDRFTYCNLISIFPTRLSTRHRLDSLTCHHVYNDECARRVRAERAARSPYKILSSLMGTSHKQFAVLYCTSTKTSTAYCHYLWTTSCAAPIGLLLYLPYSMTNPLLPFRSLPHLPTSNQR